jgi:RNA polymerase sigma-70 factor, ECF subfamily
MGAKPGLATGTVGMEKTRTSMTDRSSRAAPLRRRETHRVVARNPRRASEWRAQLCLRNALAAGEAHLAVTLLMERYGPTVDRYCRRMLGADADGEDVSQIVFIQAFEAIQRMSPIDNPCAWLLGIARHRCLDRLKGRRRAPVLADTDQLEHAADGDTPCDVVARDPGASQALDDCLAELDARSRTVVLFRFRDQLSYDAISRVTGDRPGALRVPVARALRQLRRRMEMRERQ